MPLLEHRASYVPEYTTTRVLGKRGTRVSCYPGIRRPGDQGVRARRYRGLRRPGHAGIQVPRLPPPILEGGTNHGECPAMAHDRLPELEGG